MMKATSILFTFKAFVDFHPQLEAKTTLEPRRLESKYQADESTPYEMIIHGFEPHAMQEAKPKRSPVPYPPEMNS